MIRIGHNSFGCPFFSIHPPDEEMKWPWRMTINEGGRWLSVLWFWGRELIVIFASLGHLFGVHWHVDWGWRPKWGLRSTEQGGEFLNDLTGWLGEEQL